MRAMAVTVPASQMRPRILDAFFCAGAACPDNGCHGWQVDVDPDTYRNWPMHPDSGIRAWLQSSIEVPRTTDAATRCAGRFGAHKNG